MKKILTVSALLLLISGNALAGSENDRCVKEEKVLKAQEASDCSGLRYLLNPSACFATKKALKEFSSGKCRNIGAGENVEFSAQQVIPEKKSSAATISSVDTAAAKKPEAEAPKQETTLEQLKEENARLRGEVSRLTTENEQLRKTGR